MAYNFICETDSQPDWNKINRLLSKYNKLEAFPISLPEKEFSALAISVPMKNVGIQAYKEFLSLYKKLSNRYKFTVFDLYYGKLVDKAHLEILVKELS